MEERGERVLTDLPHERSLTSNGITSPLRPLPHAPLSQPGREAAMKVTTAKAPCCVTLK